MSKEAQHVSTRPPPRPTIGPPELATSVPLERLWKLFPQIQQQGLLRQLTRLVAQSLAPPERKEGANE
jgi:hypothetical protein